MKAGFSEDISKQIIGILFLNNPCYIEINFNLNNIRSVYLDTDGDNALAEELRHIFYNMGIFLKYSAFSDTLNLCSPNWVGYGDNRWTGEWKPGDSYSGVHYGHNS